MNLWYWTSLVISAGLTQGSLRSAGWCRTASHASGVRVQHHSLARVSRPQQASPEVSIWWPSGIPRGQAEVLEASWDLGWGSACNHTFTSAHLLAQVSYEANPRCRSWGNRLYLFIKRDTESYLKGLDSKRRIIVSYYITEEEETITSSQTWLLSVDQFSPWSQQVIKSSGWSVVWYSSCLLLCAHTHCT